jgi:hypothetical protein
MFILSVSAIYLTQLCYVAFSEYCEHYDSDLMALIPVTELGVILVRFIVIEIRV